MTKNNMYNLEDNSKYFIDIDNKVNPWNEGEPFLKGYRIENVIYPKAEFSISPKEINQEPALTIWKRNNPDTDALEFLYQTHNYIGILSYGKKVFVIECRFGVRLLERMLLVSTGFSTNDNRIGIESNLKAPKIINPALYALYFYFFHKLRKASYLGFPKTYQKKYLHERKIIGQPNINRILNRDIPFTGKISSITYKREFDIEIVSVLDKAAKIARKQFPKFASVFKAEIQDLKKFSGNKLVDSAMIKKAKSSKALISPIYQPFKEVLYIAEWIISNKPLNPSAKENQSSILFDVAALWEDYVYKLLKEKLSDWDVSKPEHKVYDKKFYERKIIPDIVMEKDGRVLVFDAKYKRMAFVRKTEYGMGDVDRSDFFQIHTYMFYYHAQKGKKLVAGGLLYPLSEPHNKEVCKSDKLFGLADAVSGNFVIDGIELNEENTNDNIFDDIETKFINRINLLIPQNQTNVLQTF